MPDYSEIDQPERNPLRFKEKDPSLSSLVCQELDKLDKMGVPVVSAQELESSSIASGQLCLGLETKALSDFYQKYHLEEYNSFRSKHRIYPNGDDNDEYRDQRDWAKELFEKIIELKTPVIFVVNSDIDQEYDIENIDVGFAQAEFEWLVDFYTPKDFPLKIVIGLPNHKGKL